MRAGSGSSASQDQGRGSVDLKAEFAKLRSVREMGPEGFAKSWGEVSAALLENGVAAQAGCASAASDGPASVLANLGVGANLALAQGGVNLADLGDAEQLSDLSFAGMTYSMEIFPRTSMTSVLGGISAVTLTSLLAALWPAVHASRLQPVGAMRQ